MPNENLRTELEQLAAVAVAILEDLDYGEADTNAEVKPSPYFISRTDMVLSGISDERYRQDEKWGPQHHDPFTWLLILMEEVGEFAEEVEIGETEFFPESASVLSMIMGAGRMAKDLLEKQDLG